MVKKGVRNLWKTYGEHNRIYVGFCYFRMALGVHFGDPGQHKNTNNVFVFGYFTGVGSGRVLGCFLDAFWMLFGTLLVACW